MGASYAIVSYPEMSKRQQQLRLGDRVVIGGDKEGTLRFLGKTSFASGLWAGVQLDRPVGKNDGSVAGKRLIYWLFPFLANHS